MISVTELTEFFSVTNNKIEKLLSKNAFFFLVLISVCLLLVGIPVLSQSANIINLDAWGYMAVAKYYLTDPSPRLRDAYTVGPLILLIITTSKFILLKLFEWSHLADVLLLKGLAIACYVSIVVSAGIYLRRYASPGIVVVFLILFMGLPSWEMDNMTLNGELMSLAWLTILLAYLYKDDGSPSVYLVALLTLLVIYTKIQSIILLAILLVGFYKDRNDLLKALAVVFSGFILVEAILLFNGIGLLRNVSNMFAYAANPIMEKGAQATSFSLFDSLVNNRFFVNFSWAVEKLQRFVPLFGFVFIYYLLTSHKNGKKVFQDWRVWVLALFLTILIPGRQYEHYTLYGILFVIAMAGPMLHELNKIDKARHISYATLIVVLCFFTFNTVKLIRPLAETQLRIGPEAQTALQITQSTGGRVYIHGWDSSLYSLFNGWADDISIFSVTSKHIDPTTYLDRLVAKRYEYIIDVVGYSGYLDDPAYKINRSTIYGFYLVDYYDLVFYKNGLGVFRIKPAYRK